MSQNEEKREGFYLSEEGEWIPEGWQIVSLERHCEEITVGFVGSMAEHYVCLLYTSPSPRDA